MKIRRILHTSTPGSKSWIQKDPKVEPAADTSSVEYVNLRKALVSEAWNCNGSFLVLKRASKKTGARRGAPGNDKFTETSTASESKTFGFSCFSVFCLQAFWSSPPCCLFQVCPDPEWTSAADDEAPPPTCDAKNACYGSPSAAWWRQTPSTWWCSASLPWTPSAWPLSTTTSPAGWPSSCVGFLVGSSAALTLQGTINLI